MPGRTPYEAFSAFVEPLADALSCVVRTKIQHSAGGNAVVDKEHQLWLTGSDDNPYVKLDHTSGRPKLELLARMRYMLIHREDHDGLGGYRVTTRAYDYSVQTQDKQLVLAFHWHPTGSSDVTTPHLHIGAQQLSPTSVLSHKDHINTGRITLETAVRTAVDLGAKPKFEDWAEILEICEGPHLRHRSWSRDFELETGQKIS